jgi:hypothetical protein
MQASMFKLLKAFLAHKTQKANGNTSSHVQLCKVFSQCFYVGFPLRAYYDEMEKFLTLYRKESVDAKKEGKLDKHKAGPIT